MKRLVKEIGKYLIAALVAACALSWVIAQMKIDTDFFDKSAFMNALITFSTGAMVSIFLTIFHSNNERISLLRDKYHAKTLYLLVIICNALIVLLSSFVGSENTFFGIGLDNLATTAAASLGVLLTWFVIQIISIFFAKTNSN